MAFEGQQAGSGKAQVKYGSNGETDELFVGRTVGELRTARGDALNIPSDARAYKGSTLLNDDYVVQSGDVIEFHRRMGEKG
jgi:hypothetical protein